MSKRPQNSSLSPDPVRRRAAARVDSPRGAPFWLAFATFVVACGHDPDRQTLAGLRAVEPDLEEVEVRDGIDQAMAGYRKFLAEAPTSALTPEAMRRLADLELEKEYGTSADAHPRTLAAAAPTPASPLAMPERAKPGPATPLPTTPGWGPAPDAESASAFEARASQVSEFRYAEESDDWTVPGATASHGAPSGPVEALALYDEILTRYPDYAHNDQVLYQKARAFDELGRVDEAIEVSAQLVEKYPNSRHLDEVHFRRGEYYFTRKKWLEAEKAYAAIVPIGARSEYFELALYKLGWTFYKQMMLPEALQTYLTLLDHKVATEYDFDQTVDEASAQRVADSHRVMSLCFSDLGGADAVAELFSKSGARPYENRVYRHLAEFYFEKLRYQDAADTYSAFIERYPFHASSPHYGMRVVEIYQAGDFPKLVLEAKKDFASRYALDADYWKHFDPATSPEVVAYLKKNLEDLASHYHALYQNPENPEEKAAAFGESASWYRRYISSFADAPETPAIHYRLADLLLENESFGAAAQEYERIAYGYAAHSRAAAAGYAAIFAHRKAEERAAESEREAIRREAVASTVRFVDHFPDHEHAAKVLGVAVQDLYELKSYSQAIELGLRLTGSYPTADVAIRRSAWLAVGHSAFEIADFAAAEQAYGSVLELMAADDGTRADVVNNLAAAVYKQGEHANEAGDFRAAADHYLRVAKLAPESTIRPIADYDAGAALLRLEDWNGALAVLERFRDQNPEHELHQEATQQVAFVYRKTGQSSRAAEEYERVAREAEKPELRAESLLVAGELYEEAKLAAKAIAVYESYVSEFTDPIETLVATRFKMATLYLESNDPAARSLQLREIVAIDRAAGASRSDAVRGTAARSALLLAEEEFAQFDALELRQPFERSLVEKQNRMNALMASLGSLVDYQVGEVTAAATYYMAETYGDFSRSLLDSERPSDVAGPELADYEGMLEEEAFPFEEKAIAVHAKNLDLMRTGVYNAWIEKSLARLAVLMPGRYAKPEESTGPLASLEGFAYRIPGLPATAAPETDATTAAQESPAPEAGATAAAQEPPAPEVDAIAAAQDPSAPEADPSAAAQGPSAPEADASAAAQGPSAPEAAHAEVEPTETSLAPETAPADGEASPAPAPPAAPAVEEESDVPAN